ncbi:MAG: hydroxymethylglutaryl-CoA lyase [Gammaproteobacteria bacterium]|nr:hydroxymethylglutaryl-CoA lyase [Gammaproteobacteria bacterium]
MAGQMMDNRVTINEVGPRDGLQSQSRILPVAGRLRLIKALEGAGISRIEAGSFVSPKAVPAMADTGLLLPDLDQRGPVNHSFLIPNLKGYQLAREAGAESVTMVVYASDTMARRNVRMGMDEAEAAAFEIIDLARADDIEVIVIAAVCFGCPFEDAVDAAVVGGIAGRFAAAGIHRLVLADTIGAADPAQVSALLTPLVEAHGPGIFGCHFHDTRAMALANVYAAVQAGVRWFDSSIGGLGGCPFAPGASGNVATEDVMVMLHQMGLQTGIDAARLLAASDLATELTGTAPGGRVREWLRGQVS